jgi:uncharacterized protein
MSRDYPDWVNPWTAAEGQRQFAGSMALSQMLRLLPLLSSEDGLVRFELAFQLDQERRPEIDIQVIAELPLICQRSLQQYLEPIRRQSVVIVVMTQAEQDLLPEAAEPVLVEEGRIALKRLVEDELLLAVPLVPRNPDVDIVDLSTGDNEIVEDEKRQPFAELAKLKSSLEQK